MWLAVMMAPPSAPRCRSMTLVPGVERTPEAGRAVMCWRWAELQGVS